MRQVNLSLEHIQDGIFSNKYQIDQSNKFKSRCSDGQYINSPDLPPLALAGGDAGELALLLATAQNYGFTIDEKKAFDILLELVGGPKNFSYHSDKESEKNIPGHGCVHLQHLRLHPDSYFLHPESINTINEQIISAKKEGAQETILENKFQNGAVLQIRGEWGVYPQFHLDTAQGSVPVQVIIFHKTFIDTRHRELSKRLIESKAVTLFDDLDEEYLYEVLSSMTDDHFLETLKRTAKGLPIYEVTFEKNGTFTVESLGFVMGIV